MQYLLGVDVGSTNLKAVAYDFTGRILAEARRSAKTYYLQDGWAELDPLELWQGVAAALREVTATLQGAICLGVGIASNGEDCFVDAQGNPVCRALRWFDTRTTGIAKAWEAFGYERVYAITGIRPNPVAGITKLQWIKTHDPEAYQHGRFWISMQGFVSMRLTGVATTSWTNACRTMAFDLQTRDWSETILQAAGIPKTLFPQPVRPGSLLGKVHVEASQITGLPSGTPVYAGGVDYACGALATGILQTGQLLDSTGTSEEIVALVDTPQANPAYMDENFTSVCYVANDKYYLMGLIVAAGGIFEWLRRTFANVSFTELMEEAKAMPIGSHGVMMMPHFSGRHTLGNDPLARGAFLGLTRSVKRGDIVRAMLEGLCFEMREIIDKAQEISDSFITSIYAIGGAAKSPFWLQMKADVSGLQVHHRHVREAAALGAAMLAGLGCGVYANAEAAVRQVSAKLPETIYTPNAVCHEAYLKLYSLYKKLYPTLKTWNREVAAMQVYLHT